MAQAALHQCPGTMVKFKFKCRNGNALVRDEDGLAESFLNKLNEEIDHLCSLRFTEEELTYLSTIRYFKRDFIDMLRLLQLNRSHILTYVEDKKLQIEINGPIFLAIWFEVPVLAIVSELNSKLGKRTEYESIKVGKENLNKKIDYLNNNVHKDSDFRFVDFGTRRRHSFDWQRYVIDTLLTKAENWFIGTSNLYFAMRYKMPSIGTMAHLWFQLFQRMDYQLANSQKAALDAWVREYQGDLGIALSDIGGFKWFLKDFNPFYAKLFDGCRHDSGDPFWWADKLVKHYRKLGIDPTTKTAVFSDGLTIPMAIRLYNSFNHMIKTSFGIGTHLTNDMGYEALQIVIKMVECNGGPVSKRSDSKGKGMCEDPEFDAYFAKVIKEELERK